MVQSAVLERPPAAIAPPEPDLTPAEAVRRAEELIPLLREQQEEADERGYYSQEVHEAMLRAGLYRMVQPRMFGGYQFGMRTLLQVTAKIARGHPSSAWCYCLSSSHALLLAAHWPEPVQREMFGPDGDFRAPHRAAPAGTFTPVEGGYQVNGTWSYSSGIPYATHFAGGAAIPLPGGGPAIVNFFVSRDKVEMISDWGGDAALGMQGSGSNSARLTDVFIPHEHFCRGDVLFGQEIDWTKGTIGARLHNDPTYLGVAGGIYHLTFSAIMSGAAWAALDEYEEAIATRKVIGNPRMTLAEDADIHRSLGEILALIESAEAIMYGAIGHWEESIDRWARTGAPITPEDTMRIWAMGRQSSFMSCQAVEMMFHTATPRSANRGQRLQRYFRDVQMFRIHPSSQNWVPHARGETHLGLSPSKFAARR